MKSKFRDALIEIVITPELTDPQSLVEQAKIQRHSISKTRDSFEKDDEVWAVFDHDGRDENRLRHARDLCDGAGIGIGFSNPCFEVWLILHKDDYQKPCDSKRAQKDLQSHLPDYDRHRSKRADFNPLLKDLEAAETRAERQLAQREKEGAPHGPPSTSVFRLTRAIKREAQKRPDPLRR